MIRALLGLTLIAGSISSAGCLSSDDDGDPATYIPIDQIGARHKAAYCTFLVRCGLFPDQATCLGARLTESFELDPTIELAVATGRIYYQSSNVKTCFDEIAAETCDRTDEDGRMISSACLQFLRGTVGGGGTCFVGAECISGYCNGGNAGLTCQQGQCIGDTPPSVEPGRLNGACTDAGCVAGTYCEANICTPLKPADFACGNDYECAYGLGCGGPSTATRRCKVLPGLGESCPDYVCRDDGLHCEAGICEQLGVTGAPCVSSTSCSPYYECDLTTSICKSFPTLGQACSGRCFEADTYCRVAKCEAAQPDGAPCSSELACASGYCDGSTCVTPTACQ